MADDAATVEQLRAELRRARHEIEQRDRALAQALEQQTATAEVFRVIAASPTDLNGVLDAICEAAARLCDAPSAATKGPRWLHRLASPRDGCVMGPPM
jgi:hypothetical protein